MLFIRLLHLEDNEDDALIIREVLEKSGIDFQLRSVETKADYLDALDSDRYDLILSDPDHGIFDFGCLSASEAARSKCPEVPFIVVSGLSPEDQQAENIRAIGIPFVTKQELEQLVPTIKMMLSGGE